MRDSAGDTKDQETEIQTSEPRRVGEAVPALNAGGGTQMQKSLRTPPNQHDCGRRPRRPCRSDTECPKNAPSCFPSRPAFSQGSGWELRSQPLRTQATPRRLRESAVLSSWLQVAARAPRNLHPLDLSQQATKGHVLSLPGISPSPAWTHRQLPHDARFRGETH